jgi:hypothetical protein
MFHKTGQCQVLSEPYILEQVERLFSSRVLEKEKSGSSKEEVTALLRAALLLLAPDPDKEYVIKPCFTTMSMFHLFREALSGIKEVFLYRALKPAAASHCSYHDTYAVTAEMLLGWIASYPAAYNSWQEEMVMEKQHLQSLLTLSAIGHYIAQTKNRSDIKSYSYESLLRDKIGFCTSIFKDLGISEELVGVALKAMEKDSQQNSICAKGTLGKVEIDKGVLDNVKKIGREVLGVDLVGDGCQIGNMPHKWDTEHY